MANKIDLKYLTLEIFKNAGAPVYKDQPEKAYEIVRKFLGEI